jgi:hypothetical protein
MNGLVWTQANPLGSQALTNKIEQKQKTLLLQKYYSDLKWSPDVV